MPWQSGRLHDSAVAAGLRWDRAAVHPVGRRLQEARSLPRKKQEPIKADVARLIGGLLRGLRRTAGYRAVKDAASVRGCPAAQQTIYAYERGCLAPSLKQFMELVEFYALTTEGAPQGIRCQGQAGSLAGLATPAQHT